MAQNPLASPSAAASQASKVVGALSGASGMDSIRPKNDARRTLDSLIGRNSQRSGMSRRIVAIRSPVRLRQCASWAHSFE